MKSDRTTPAPLPREILASCAIQKKLSIQAMREMDDLPPMRRMAVMVIGVDVGNDATAALALHLDDGRHLLGGREFARWLGLR